MTTYVCIIITGYKLRVFMDNILSCKIIKNRTVFVVGEIY